MRRPVATSYSTMTVRAEKDHRGEPMNRTTAQTLLALSLAGCCFGGHPGGTPPPPSGPAAGATLAPGFMPDPMMVTGTAGGMISASTFSGDCRGYVGLTPNHSFTLTAPFSTLRFTVTSNAQDTTMVVRSPTGQVFCNDDTNGLSPEIVNSFPAGVVQVYVGVYSSGTPGMPYTMDVSQTGGAFGGGGIIPTTPPVIGPNGIPSSCGMSASAPFYGVITVGSSVILGGHTPWSGPDGQGGYATASTNWAPEMGQYVGQRTIVTSLEGVDDAGCPVVHVAADNGGFYWRIGSMSL
jgi:hypothetical protein